MGGGLTAWCARFGVGEEDDACFAFFDEGGEGGFRRVVGLDFAAEVGEGDGVAYFGRSVGIHGFGFGCRSFFFLRLGFCCSFLLLCGWRSRRWCWAFAEFDHCDFLVDELWEEARGSFEGAR